MGATKRKAIEAAGWKVGDTADFLRMSDEERRLLDARVELALAIRRQPAFIAKATWGNPQDEPATCRQDRTRRLRCFNGTTHPSVHCSGRKDRRENRKAEGQKAGILQDGNTDFRSRDIRVGGYACMRACVELT